MEKSILKPKGTLQSALLLGGAALLCNLGSYLVAPESSIPIGNIFLFISAAVLGLPGALVAVSVGVFPEIIFTADVLYAVRLFILCSGVGYAAERFPRIPAFASAMGIWISILGPFYAYLHYSDLLAAHWTSEYTILVAFAEIVVCLLAGTLLLSQVVWANVSAKPRQMSASYVLVHLLTLVSTMSLLAALALLSLAATPADISNSFTGSADIFVLIVFLSLSVPALIGWKGTAIFPHWDRNVILGTGSQSMVPSENAWLQSESSAEYESGRWSGSIDPNATNEEVWEEVHGSKGVCLILQDGTVSFLNDQAKDLLGIQHNHPHGKKIDDLGLPSDVTNKLWSILARTPEEGSLTTEIKLNQLPHSLRFYEATTERSRATDIPSDAPKPQHPEGTLITLKDITERRTVESHLLQAQKMESLGNVIGGIAHAFNNYLTAIVGYASFARRASDQKVMLASLNQILEAAQTASELVWTLLDFAEGKPSDMKKVNLTELLSGREEFLQKLVGEAHEIKLHLPDESVGVSADTNLLIQLLTNLVLNSKEALGESGEIEIELGMENIEDGIAQLHPGARPGEFARLRVKDTGHGMSTEMLSRAFDPLFTTKSGQGQSGLGLSIVFAIVRAHDGFLTAESQLEKGTIISIYLPTAELETAGTSRTESTPSTVEDTQAEEHHERILIVEDEPTVRDLVQKMLSTLGYEVSTCSNGEEALQLWDSEEFDMLLVDMLMPKMSGVELIDSLQAKGGVLKTLIMTGQGTQQHDGLEDYHVISKPFDMDKLAQSVRDTLQEAQA